MMMIRLLLFAAPCLFLIACSGPGIGDDRLNGQTSSPFRDHTVRLVVDGEARVVDLGLVDHTTFTGKDAIRLTRVVEIAAIDQPWEFHYTFEANDGWSVLNDGLNADPSKLPYYGELDHGFIVHCDDEADGLCVEWTETVALPRVLRIKGIDGGAIEAVPIQPGSILVAAGDTRALVPLSTLATLEITHHSYESLGLVTVVRLTDVLHAAGLEQPQLFAYKIFGDDGWSNNDDLLLPYENVLHSYVWLDERRILTEEEWDTDLCCWRVRDARVIRGVPVSLSSPAAGANSKLRAPVQDAP
jgi:hypothetical protein